jgi:hypothetical protein
MNLESEMEWWIEIWGRGNGSDGGEVRVGYGVYGMSSLEMWMWVWKRHYSSCVLCSCAG